MTCYFVGILNIKNTNLFFINQLICFLINKNPDNISRVKIYINEKYTEENLKIPTVLSKANGSYIFAFETIFFRCIDKRESFDELVLVYMIRGYSYSFSREEWRVLSGLLRS